MKLGSVNLDQFRDTPISIINTPLAAQKDQYLFMVKYTQVKKMLIFSYIVIF